MIKNFPAQDNYECLIYKLDEFIRKYYRNRMIRGLLWCAGILLFSYLVIAISEYLGHFNTLVRTLVFYLYILSNLLVIIIYIIIPLLQLNKIGKLISYDQAAMIIGKHFSEVSDKLLNTLQLKRMFDNDKGTENLELIYASIDQKTGELKPIPFAIAINLKENRKYIKYVAVPLLLVFSLLVAFPGVLKESTKRLVEHGKYFEKPLPFKFILLNDSLNAVKNEDFEVRMKTDGKTTPQNVMIEYEGKEIMMNRLKTNVFTTLLKNLRENVNFRFVVDKYSSAPYEIKVLPKPLLMKFKIRIDYPPYLRKETTYVDNTGDLTFPEGSALFWQFTTQDAENMTMVFNDGNVNLKRVGKNDYEYKRTFLKNNSYIVHPRNKFLRNNDSIRYFLTIIPDEYPRINVSSQKDTLSNKYVFFNGEIADDYGLTRLAFKYKFVKTDDSSRINKQNEVNIPLVSDKSSQEFYYSWDMGDMITKPGDEVEYYFQVWDNDGVNGNKSTVSEKFYYRAPTHRELEEKMDQLSDELKKDLNKSASHAKDIQKDLEKARRNLLENKDIKWEDNKLIQDIIKRQEDLKKEIDQIKQKYIEDIVNHDDNKETNPELLEKYKQVYDMFQQLIPEDVKDLYKQLEELLKNNQKDDVQKGVEKIDKNNKDLEKELDRALEMFKKLEVEQKTDEVIGQLNDLAKDQKELSDKSKDKKSDKEEIQKKQELLDERFKDIKKDIKDLEKENNELKNKEELQNTDQDQQDIQQEMDKSMENIKSGKNSKTSEHQKNASDKLNDLAEKYNAMKEGGEMKTLDIDIDRLRHILSNLLYVSFEQERLMGELQTITTYNPQYVELGKKQKNLKGDCQMIEDSLYSLSMQLISISNFVNREISEINFNMDKTIEMLARREIPQARSNQQYVMTSVNNLALLLTEVLKNLQEESANKSASGKSGKKSKKQGKGKKPNDITSIKKLQEELSKQIGECKSHIQYGQNGKNGQYSREFARMAQQQEMLRNELRRLNEQQNKGGTKPFGDLEGIQKKMEETEKDLVNKRITPETLERQRDITVKLLEAEKAEHEQGQDEKRKSTTARDIFSLSPPSLEDYKKKKLKEVELIQSVPAIFNEFYKIKVKEYLNQIP